MFEKAFFYWHDFFSLQIITRLRLIIIVWWLYLGGDPLVQSTRNIAWIPSLLHPGRCVVSGLYICWDGESTTIISWRLGNWWVVQDIQVYTYFQPSILLRPSCFSFSSFYWNAGSNISIRIRKTRSYKPL